MLRVATALLALGIALLPATPVQAQALCREEINNRSPASQNLLRLELYNVGSRRLRVYWLNGNGQRQFYAYVNPGEVYRGTSYYRHIWVITDGQNNCVQVFHVGAQGVSMQMR
jgi:hypothetical protein